MSIILLAKKLTYVVGKSLEYIDIDKEIEETVSILTRNKKLPAGKRSRTDTPKR
jgi:hypothetical protein